MILEAALRLLKHYGPQKTTIADIAREVGIGTGSVYLEFPSKDELVVALSSRVHEQVFGKVRAAYQKKRGGLDVKLKAALEARVEAFFQLHQEGAHTCDLVHCGRVPSSPMWARFEAQEVALFAELLQAGAAQDVFVVKHPERTARALLCAYARFAPPQLFSLSPVELRAELDAMHELVLYGLLRR